MKKVIILWVMVLTALSTEAQELTVNYQVKFDTSSPELFAEAGLNEDMRRSLAEAYKDVVMNYRLSYKNGESDFRVVVGKEPQIIFFMGKSMDINATLAQQADNYSYKNHREGIVLDKTSVFGKTFVVKDSIRVPHFNLVEGQKKDICGYECLKAVSDDGKTTIWYSPAIPVKNEPIVTGLNGLVLQYANGQQIFEAVSVSDTATINITKPDADKTISKDEFNKMVAKRVEMMKRQ